MVISIEEIKNLEVNNLTDLEQAKDNIVEIKSVVTDLEASLNKSKADNLKLKDQWKKLKDDQAKEIKKAKSNATKGLINPRVKKDIDSAAKWIVSKEDFDQLKTELENLKANAEQEKAAAIKHFKDLYEAEKQKNDNHSCPPASTLTAEQTQQLNDYPHLEKKIKELTAKLKTAAPSLTPDSENQVKAFLKLNSTDLLPSDWSIKLITCHNELNNRKEEFIKRAKARIASL